MRIIQSVGRAGKVIGREDDKARNLEVGGSLVTIQALIQ